MTKNPIPYHNQSPGGWWIAIYLQRAVWSNVPPPTPRSRCLARKITTILEAPDRESAYEKALALKTQVEQEELPGTTQKRSRY